MGLQEGARQHRRARPLCRPGLVPDGHVLRGSNHPEPVHSWVAVLVPQEAAQEKIAQEKDGQEGLTRTRNRGLQHLYEDGRGAPRRD